MTGKNGRLNAEGEDKLCYFFFFAQPERVHGKESDSAQSRALDSAGVGCVKEIILVFYLDVKSTIMFDVNNVHLHCLLL